MTEQMTEFVIRLSNRPGALAGIAESLAQAGVNIEAITSYGYGEEGITRLVVNDALTARRVLRSVPIRAEENRILRATLPNRPGELAALTRRLGDAAINIEAMYVLHTGGDRLDIALAVDDPDGAAPHLPVRGSAHA